MATVNKVRVTFSDAAVSDFTTGASDYVVAQVGTMTASRVVTLPPAAKIPAGSDVLVVDESFTVTSTNTLVVTASGSDTIGNAVTTETISAGGGFRRFTSDGASRWLITASTPALTMVAGAVSDGSFAAVPSDGTIAYDTTNFKLYVRSGGAWKSTAALT